MAVITRATASKLRRNKDAVENETPRVGPTTETIIMTWFGDGDLPEDLRRPPPGQEMYLYDELPSQFGLRRQPVPASAPPPPVQAHDPLFWIFMGTVAFSAILLSIFDEKY